MKIYLASGNAHKFGEFAGMVEAARLPVEFRSAQAIGGMPEVEETGDTFEANAELKAMALAQVVGPAGWVLADDSGLLVDALGGQPGVHSARYAGPGADAEANNGKLLQELEGLPMERRTARFVCVLCFTQAGRPAAFFRGTCEGHILLEPAGMEGFGYDPLFRPLGHGQSFAQLGARVKEVLSHRAEAVAEWVEYMRIFLGRPEGRA